MVAVEEAEKGARASDPTQQPVVEEDRPARRQVDTSGEIKAVWMYPKRYIPHSWAFGSHFVHSPPWSVLPDIYHRGRYIPPERQRHQSYRPDKYMWDNHWVNMSSYYSNIYKPSRFDFLFPRYSLDYSDIPDSWIDDRFTRAWNEAYPGCGFDYVMRENAEKRQHQREKELAGLFADTTDLARAIRLVREGYCYPTTMDQYWLQPKLHRLFASQDVKRELPGSVASYVPRRYLYNYGVKDRFHDAVDLCRTGAITPEQFDRHWLKPDYYDHAAGHWRVVTA